MSKEKYGLDRLRELNENGWKEAIIYIAKQLIDDSKVYFKQDETHPYPAEKISVLKKRLSQIGEISIDERDKEPIKNKRKSHHIHGRKLNKLLSVIHDKELSELIKKDIREIENCIANDAPKAAIILCGSSLEAILTDWLKQKNIDDVKTAFSKISPNQKFKKIEDMSLKQLIGICYEMGLIKEGHLQISNAIRDYRNLIHPGVSLRRQYKPTKRIAKIGLELILEILELRARA